MKYVVHELLNLVEYHKVLSLPTIFISLSVQIKIHLLSNVIVMGNHLAVFFAHVLRTLPLLEHNAQSTRYENLWCKAEQNNCTLYIISKASHRDGSHVKLAIWILVYPTSNEKAISMKIPS